MFILTLDGCCSGGMLSDSYWQDPY